MLLMEDIKTLIMQLDLLAVKEGHNDTEVLQKVVSAINRITGETSLDKIYINQIDNFNIPDVFVLPVYNKEFSTYLMNDDLTEVCPFGYTVEIHTRCFDRYTAAELASVILHDILQNVQSSTAKVRFLKAYNAAISGYKMETIMDTFDSFSNSEVCFMGYTDICMRPFRVPVMDYDYTGCDEVLKNIGLGDAYDSYLEKYYDSSKNWKANPDSEHDSVEGIIEEELKMDLTTMRTIIRSCLDKDIRHYYTMIRDGVPLVTLTFLMGKKSSADSMGFVSRRVHFKRRHPTYMDKKNEGTASLMESFNNPKTQIELRFQVDKIIADMRYAETEAEREIILIKIKNLTVKLAKEYTKAEAAYKKNPGDVTLRDRMEYLQNFLDELDMLREKTVKMEIKKRRFGIFINYPEGYQEEPVFVSQP